MNNALQQYVYTRACSVTKTPVGPNIYKTQKHACKAAGFHWCWHPGTMGAFVSSSASASSTSPEVHAGVSCGRSALGTGGGSESSAAALPVNETSLDDLLVESGASSWWGRSKAGFTGGLRGASWGSWATEASLRGEQARAG